MSELISYITSHAKQSNEGIDVAFFKVAVSPDATAEELRKAISSHKGVFCDVDLFDGKEHSFIEIGGWVGDQGLALMFFGLGAHLGLWQLLTPKVVLGDLVPDDTAKELASQGMVTIQATDKDAGLAAKTETAE